MAKAVYGNNKSVVFYVLLSVCHLKLVSASSTFQATSCPGDVLTTECAIKGRGATLWLGTAFQCVSTNHLIVLRHSQFGRLHNITVTCNNGAIVSRALGVVNNSYISQLSVTMSLELNNTTVECWYNHNLTDTVIKQIQIVVLATGKAGKSTNCQCIRTCRYQGQGSHICIYCEMHLHVSSILTLV